jgi:hypothetical protein
LFLLIVTQGSVVLIIFIFGLIAFFFFFLLMIVVMVVIMWQLSNFLRVFSRRYRDHDLEGVLHLRNVLRRVGLWLWLRWYIPWLQLTSGLTSSALAGCAVRMNHLKFEKRRE